MTPGTRLGPYEIVDRLGAGGMGVVYKARDTRLDRLVALKVLLPDKVGDPERKRRFIQEAKSASALNHPNIVVIYDIGEEGGVEYMAMELIPGKPLDQMIPRNGMRFNDLLRSAAQVADALAKAHAAGIVHRDLKPANVMVTPEGLVKVLDFGLAKLIQPADRDGASRDDETATMGAHTEDGTVLGTTAYMSPEQAEARQIDGRSDVFSFGAMLYEMATGQRAFSRDTRLSTLAAILRDEPTLPAEIRADLPRDLTRVIARCLRKDPARRYQNAADLKLELDELREESDSGKLGAAAAAPARAPVPTSRLEWIGAGLTGLLVLIVAGLYIWGRSQDSPKTDAGLKPVPLTSYPGVQRLASFSPDGNQVAFSWNGEAHDNYDIYVKLVGQGAPLRLTNDPGDDDSPRWSPDGRTIAFLRFSRDTSAALILVPPLGGPERKVAQLYFHDPRGPLTNQLSWSPDSKFLIVSSAATPDGFDRLVAISLESGAIRPLTNPPPNIDDVEPALSPDGRFLAFSRVSGLNISQLLILPVSEKLEPRGEPRILPLTDAAPAEPTWTADGRDILFTTGSSNANVTLSRVPASGSGKSSPLPFSGTGAENPSVAPQGHRLAYTRVFQDTNVWRAPLTGGASAKAPSERLIASPFREVFPQYSPDGQRIAFHSDRDGTVQIWTCHADGLQCVQLTNMSGLTQGTPHWSPDGQRISFDSNTGGRWEIYTVAADGGPPRPVTNDPSTNIISSWSHDGRWIYFSSNRSGRFEVWKAPSQGGAAVQVTRNVGQATMESPDGKDLYFTKNDGIDGVWKMPVEGGDESQVLKQSIHRYNFAVTEQGLYFTRQRSSDGSSEVQYLNFSTGAVSDIAKIEGTVDLGLAVSPDRKSLLFAQADYRGSNLMLVEGFR
jgi:eukaryotic-like serine/threonine-protein kinase